jgi:putative FmdB family regulatory protein
LPTYSYRCTDCGEAFDIVQSFTDDSLTICPNCGGNLRKVFTPVGVSFSGSGFYRTDSRAADSSAASGADSSAASGSGSTDSPTKPADKPATPTKSSDSTPKKPKKPEKS